MQFKPANSHTHQVQQMQPDEHRGCGHCFSQDQKEFNGELAIHFTGLKGLEKPIVWVFPKLLVCLNCGFTELTVPERELRVLAEGAPVDGALIWRRTA